MTGKPAIRVEAAAERLSPSRVLVVDDDPAIRQEYRLAFAGPAPAAASGAYRDLESDLFGGATAPATADMMFDLTICSQGEEAVAAVAEAVAAGQPYSVAFIDVRMPPGIDGITAAERMIEIDPALNAVIVTGYSDVPRHEIHERLRQGSFFYFQKPFLGDEFMQLAWALHCKRAAELRLRKTNEGLQEEVARRTAELRVAAQLAMASSQAKSDFLANMSHELRTPLNAIIGFSDIIKSELMGPVGNARYVEYSVDINNSAQHLLKIINDILDFSKIEAGEMALQEGIVDIAESLSFCLRLVQHRALQSKLTLSVDVAPDVPAIRADERKLKQALINLLANAVKFTPVDGRVAVRVTIGAGGDLVIQVNDTGIGMAPGDVARALEPFGQVDRGFTKSYDGTGLGLPLARSLVELHGGTLAIESELGKGTTVTITIPAARLIRG